ncbi:MAG: ABC transporter substrate-binding protein [Candidatus Limnocylindria bacterium]
MTHDCDHPPSVLSLPRITTSAIQPGSDSAAIDAQVRSGGERGESTFHLDDAALREALPDVILGQTLCEVCAVTLGQLPPMAGRTPVLVPLEGGCIEGILDDIARIADALDRRRAGDALIEGLRRRMTRVDAEVAGAPRPTVACLEWLAPLFNAGHWVPEQVAHAGGQEVLGEAGARSREVAWSDLAASDADVIVLMPCGFDAERAVIEAAALRDRPQWRALRAVRDGRAYAVDGSAYFSRPGPRVVDGVEVLAAILHPDRSTLPAGARVLPVA